MKTAAKIGLGVGGVVGLLVAVVAVRTATFKAPAAADLSTVKLAPAVSVDRTAAALHLSQAIQIQTISHQDKADDQPVQWDRLHAWLQTTYPAAHAAMSREVVDGHTLIYTWKGSDPSLAPTVLMAPQDVVAVPPGTTED
ncbi:hypothetical protein BH11PSE1_BH11PSE1_20400 [soil metagenome]